MEKRRKSFKRLFANEKGMTLIEAMGGLVILALTLIMIYSGFLTAQKIIDHGNDLETQSQEAYASIEKGTAPQGEQDTIEVTLGSETISISGQYSEIYEEENNRGLYTFATTATQNTTNIADEVRSTFIYWVDTFNSMTRAERVANGYPRNVTNSTCRTWVSENIYGGVWPTIDDDFLERNEISLTPFYVQPYYYASTGDIFVFANDSTGDDWYTQYVYDHEEQTWYYYTKSGYSINKSWATVKSKIHGNNWYALE